VTWPAPDVKSVFSNPSLRNLILFCCKTSDKIMSSMVKNYGSRYFLVSTTKAVSKRREK
jgi:hypothetical protein